MGCQCGFNGLLIGVGPAFIFAWGAYLSTPTYVGEIVRQVDGAAWLGGPLAGTQPFEKLFSKSDFWGPSGILPPENP